jgi:hypothetical protein
MVRWIFTEAVGYSYSAGEPKKQSCQNNNQIPFAGLATVHICDDDVGNILVALSKRRLGTQETRKRSGDAQL